MARRPGSGPGTRPAPSPGSLRFLHCWPPARVRTAMTETSRVRVDRISSSTKNAHLAPDVIVGNRIVCEEGYLLAVRILEDKSTYNTVEDLSGRMVSLRAGDVLAGTLGN